MGNLFNIRDDILRDATEEEVSQIKNCYDLNLGRSKLNYKTFMILFYLEFITCMLAILLLITILEFFPVVIICIFTILGILCYMLGTSAFQGLRFIKKKLAIIDKGDFKLLDGKVMEIVNHKNNSSVYGIIFESNEGNFIIYGVLQDENTAVGNEVKLVVFNIGDNQYTDCFSPKMFSKKDLTLSIN